VAFRSVDEDGDGQGVIADRERAAGEVAAKVSVSLSTVRDFEKGRRVPIANNLTAMRVALESAGIAFVARSGITFAKPSKRAKG
jgi:hypothetical protein